MLTLFSQIMVNVNVPYVLYRKGHGLQIEKCAIFRLFPVSFSDWRKHRPVFPPIRSVAFNRKLDLRFF